MFGHSLQEKIEIFLSGGGVAVEYFESLRDSMVDGDYQANELSL